MGKAGRICKYETHIKPYLKKIPKMYSEMSEAQIAKYFGVTIQSWINYKKKYPELAECMQQSKEDLCEELKSALKKKAKGFYYTETTKTILKEGGKEVKKMEERKRYAQPDTGAIHLLLKNLDREWRNDDLTTVELKKKQMELNERKVESSEW